MKIEKLTTHIGAEVRGIDLAEAARSDDLFVEIRAALLEHKVLFLRDQDIARADHVAFASRFGALEDHPVVGSDPDHPGLVQIYKDETSPPDYYENSWHCDATWRDAPPMGAVLRCVACPPVGGDTMWADTVAAYVGLPQPVKDRIEGLEAEHDIVRSFGGRVTEEKRAQLARDFPPVRHPVVRSHPETGEKILYVNYTFTSRIIGVSEEESDSLLRLLFDRIKVPEYQVRFRWTPNAIGIWDNRSTQHYAVGDYWPEYRALERVTVSGDVVTRLG